jgi:hopene-associated glycosyltransferase HpnB
MAEDVAGGVALAIWLYLAFGHGFFWRTSVRLPMASDPPRWPSVVAVVPARNEAALLPRTLPTLVGQRYPGPFEVILVDDDSTDATAEVAAAAGGHVVRSGGPPAGWRGKVAALAAGVQAAGEPEYLLFTDADIEYPNDALRRLVAAAVAGRTDLTSQMVRLRTENVWERLLVPAFVYFFAQLYPFRRVNRPRRIAAAAGGCMLVRRAALERAGGLAAIRDAVIDDVSLGRLLKRRGPIWLGHAPDVRSVRPYSQLADLWQMVARSAYTQLRYSPAVLAATVFGMLIVYALPPAVVIAGAVSASATAAALAAAAWALMSATYVPILRYYGLRGGRAPLLPLVAVLYTLMTVDSARQHRAGRGAVWKGRVGAQ